jgi:uncharacterized protein (DUF736 family)
MLFLIEGRYRVLFCGSGSPDTMKSCQENNHIDGMERRKYKEGAEGKGPDARNEGVKDMNIGEFNLKNGRLSVGLPRTRSIFPLGVAFGRKRKRPSPGLRNPRAERQQPLGSDRGALGSHIEQDRRNLPSGNIDDPSMPEPLPIALFGTREEGFNVAWRRPKRRDDFAPVTRSNGHTATNAPAARWHGEHRR